VSSQQRRLRRQAGAASVAVALIAALRVGVAGAQTPPGSQLRDRLDPGTYVTVEATLDSAAAQGVPTRPLVAKALEGAAKQAPGDRIVLAVRSLAADLSGARRALGAEADEASLVAGAAALRAGVSSSYLVQMRDARPGTSLAWPLAVLADLVGHGVPADTAGRILTALARSGANDAAFSAFEQQVVRDVGAGVPAGAAAVARAPMGIGVGGQPPGGGPPKQPPKSHGRPDPPGKGRP